MRFAVVLTLILVAAPAAGQFQTSLDRVAIVGVSSGHDESGTTCRPDVEALATEAELILRRSGIVVDDNRKLYRAASDAIVSATTTEEERRQARLLSPHSLGIYSTAIYAGNRCAISWSVELYRMEFTELDAAVKATYFNTSGVWSVTPSDVTDALLESVEKQTTKLANEMLKARQGASR